MKVFLTGGSGFIGSAIARRLLAEGHEVHALVRAQAGLLEDLSGLQLVRGDITSLDDMDDGGAALGAADAVIHAAAVRKDYGLDDAALRSANVESGPDLLARATAAQRFLFVSSVAVHGHPEGGPANEEAPYAPSKRYGESKVEAEKALLAAAEGASAELTILRPGITYGPGDGYGMIANIARMIDRRRFLLVGNGKSRVNVLHVDDLATGIVAALTAEGAGGESFILTGPEAVPIRELVAAISRQVGKAAPFRVPEGCARLGAFVLETLHGVAGLKSDPFLTKAKVDLFTCEDRYDTSKAAACFGFAPRRSLDEGLKDAVAWWRAHDPGFEKNPDVAP